MAMVITGAPGTGKTTLIQALEADGYPVYHEVAREFIHRSQQGEDFPTPWTNLQRFTELVVEARKHQYAAALLSGGLLDRGVPDAVAYLRHNGMPVPREVWEWCLDHRYHSTVFMAPPWESIFLRDDERRETFEEAVAIHQALLYTWQELRYEVVEIPFGTVAERALFLKSLLPTP